MLHSTIGNIIELGTCFKIDSQSEAIEEESYLLAVIRYIHNNPVKAGIVEKPQDYPWSSYNGYLQNQCPNWLDVNYILDILSVNRSTAINIFERFSLESDDSAFIECEDEVLIRTFEEGKAYLINYIKNRELDLNIDQIKGNKALRNEIIMHLRINTNLSLKNIADLLGINKSTVERLMRISQ